MKSISDNFTLTLEKPEDVFSQGKIILEFKVPKIYFGFYVRDYFVTKEQVSINIAYQLREGVRHFISMIEKDLMKMAQEISDKDE